MNSSVARVGLLSFAACLMAFACQAQYHDFNHITGRHTYKMRDYMADYSKAKAAGKNLTAFLRGEDAYSMLFSGFKYEQSFTRTDFETGETTHDTSFSMKIKPKVSFGVSSHSSRPLCDMGENAALLFNYGASFNYFKFETDSLHLGHNYHSYQILAFQMGAPMTIDYKTGCEAMLDQSKRSTFGFGVGFIPTLNYAAVNFNQSSTSFKVYPYAKVEMGFFWKICMKLRASCQLGKYNYLELDNYGTNSYETNAVKLSGGPIFALSFVVMPLAFDWEEFGWY